MQTHYVFIDYDNTHVGNSILISKSSQKLIIKIYLGAHHNVIPLALACALQPLGTDAEYIQFDNGRRNTIDFNIAFQLGELAIQHPDEQFSILSNDPGFDKIVTNLKEKGINCARFSDMTSFSKHLTEPAAVIRDKSLPDKVIDIKDTQKR